jgi:hypothetical protein
LNEIDVEKCVRESFDARVCLKLMRNRIAINRLRRKKAAALAAFHLLLVSIIFGGAARAQQRPLLTEDVDVIPPGTMRLQAGVDFLQRARFPASGLSGDLTNVGVIGINIGLAPNVEFQIDGIAQRFLSIRSAAPNPPIPLSIPANANSTNDIGDFSISTKIKIRNETVHTPSIGFRFSAELPNSRQGRGIGLNATNVFGTILVGKKFGDVENGTPRLNTFGNVGLAILTAPTVLFEQNDVLLYGAAAIFRVNERFNLAGEINGRANTRRGKAPVGTESQGQARLGFQLKANNLKFDFAGIAGLTSVSPRTGVTFGVTYDSPSIFTPAK